MSFTNSRKDGLVNQVSDKGTRPERAAVETRVYWDKAFQSMLEKEELSREARLLRRKLILEAAARWGAVDRTGPLLKTDLWNEATGIDDFASIVGAHSSLICGTDISSEVVIWAGRRYSAHPLSRYSSFVVADIRHLPFRDQSFQSLHSPSTIDHLPPGQALEAVREFRRVMMKDCSALITVDNLLSFWIYPLVYRALARRITGNLWWPMTRWEVRSLLIRAGLTPVGLGSIMFSPSIGGFMMLARSRLGALANFMLKVAAAVESRSGVLFNFKAENIFSVRRSASIRMVK